MLSALFGNPCTARRRFKSIPHAGPGAAPGAFRRLKSALSRVLSLPLKGGRASAYRASDAFVVSRAGIRFFEVLSADELFGAHREEIYACLTASRFSAAVRERVALPFIRHFIALVGALPASEGQHDPLSGGLVTHSLRVWSRALEYLLRAMQGQPRELIESHAAALMYAALSHDAGKVLTDVKVRTPGGVLWRPRFESLAEFCRAHKLKHLEVEFCPGRSQGWHRQRAAELAILLCASQPMLLELIALTQDPEDVLLRRRQSALPACPDGSPVAATVWDYVTIADGEVIFEGRHPGRQLVDARTYLHSVLQQLLSMPEYPCNRPDADAFWVPSGVLVREGSELHYALRRQLYQLNPVVTSGGPMETADSFETVCRGLGVVATQGHNRMSIWYRVRCQTCTTYVKALLFQGVRPADTALICDWAPCGANPPELETLVKKVSPRELTGLTPKAEMIPSAGFELDRHVMSDTLIFMPQAEPRPRANLEKQSRLCLSALRPDGSLCPVDRTRLLAVEDLQGAAHSHKASSGGATREKTADTATAASRQGAAPSRSCRNAARVSARVTASAPGAGADADASQAEKELSVFTDITKSPETPETAETQENKGIPQADPQADSQQNQADSSINISFNTSVNSSVNSSVNNSVNNSIKGSYVYHDALGRICRWSGHGRLPGAFARAMQRDGLPREAYLVPQDAAL